MQKNTKTHIYKTKHIILIIHYYQLLFTQDEKKLLRCMNSVFQV